MHERTFCQDRTIFLNLLTHTHRGWNCFEFSNTQKRNVLWKKIIGQKMHRYVIYYSWVQNRNSFSFSSWMWCSNKFVVCSSYPWYFCLKNLDNISIYPSLVLSVHSDCNFCSSFTRLRSCLVFYNPIQEMQTSVKKPANNILWLMEKLQGLLIIFLSSFSFSFWICDDAGRSSFSDPFHYITSEIRNGC